MFIGFLGNKIKMLMMYLSYWMVLIGVSILEFLIPLIDDGVPTQWTYLHHLRILIVRGSSPNFGAQEPVESMHLVVIGA